MLLLITTLEPRPPDVSQGCGALGMALSLSWVLRQSLYRAPLLCQYLSGRLPATGVPVPSSVLSPEFQEFWVNAVRVEGLAGKVDACLEYICAARKCHDGLLFPDCFAGLLALAAAVSSAVAPESQSLDPHWFVYLYCGCATGMCSGSCVCVCVLCVHACVRVCCGMCVPMTL